MAAEAIAFGAVSNLPQADRHIRQRSRDHGVIRAEGDCVDRTACRNGDDAFARARIHEIDDALRAGVGADRAIRTESHAQDRLRRIAEAETRTG